MLEGSLSCNLQHCIIVSLTYDIVRDSFSLKNAPIWDGQGSEEIASIERTGAMVSESIVRDPCSSPG